MGHEDRRTGTEQARFGSSRPFSEEFCCPFFVFTSDWTAWAALISPSPWICRTERLTIYSCPEPVSRSVDNAQRRLTEVFSMAFVLRVTPSTAPAGETSDGGGGGRAGPSGRTAQRSLALQVRVCGAIVRRDGYTDINSRENHVDEISGEGPFRILTRRAVERSSMGELMSFA